METSGRRLFLLRFGLGGGGSRDRESCPHTDVITHGLETGTIDTGGTIPKGARTAAIQIESRRDTEIAEGLGRGEPYS